MKTELEIADLDAMEFLGCRGDPMLPATPDRAEMGRGGPNVNELKRILVGKVNPQGESAVG